ncbi:uncharacterized protein KY384_000585 [Bacidia gigantensis]|uniref:uncharacterized protein n=1 Tax=Bacidia gigantensis TaxID=2732470 RepID=UPI001D058F7A|nr:uncharacterized protein KY384_000585 [Bacidia gigantensis]KAG8525825.1 hypothetical protein KY384_000585 [Bacidia gigantensis]
MATGVSQAEKNLEGLIAEDDDSMPDVDYFMQDQKAVRAGELWVHDTGDCQWPVIICDESVVFQNYKHWHLQTSKPIESTWKAPSLLGEAYVSKGKYACLQIASLKGVWVARRHLDVFSTRVVRDMQKKSINKLQARAWKEALECFEGNGGLPGMLHWKEKLAKHMSSKISVKRSLTKNIESSEPRRAGVDDEEDNVFLTRNEGPRVKRELDADCKLTEKDASLGSRYSCKKLKTLFDKGTSILSEASCERERSNFASLDMSDKDGKRLMNSREDKVSIYVGEDRTKIQITRSNLECSPFLHRLMLRDPEEGWYVMSPFLSKLEPEEFLPVAAYLETHEYHPKLLGYLTDYARLELEFTSEERGDEILRCGKIYSIARMMEMEGLQSLTYGKIKALTMSGDPFPPVAVLRLAQKTFQSATPDLRQYLIDFFASHYWDLVRHHTEEMVQVMQNSDLANPVFGLLAGVRTDEGSQEHIMTRVSSQQEQRHSIKEEEEVGGVHDEKANGTRMCSREGQATVEDEIMKKALEESRKEEYQGEVDEELQAALELSREDR